MHFFGYCVIMRFMERKQTIPIRDAGGDSGDLAQTAAKLSEIRAVLRAEYEKQTRTPWIAVFLFNQ